MPRFLVLFENAVGLSLFDCKNINEIAISDPSVQRSFTQYSLFSQMVRLLSFFPFPSTEVALDTATNITEGQISPYLRLFLTTTLPEQTSKNPDGISLGVSDPKLAGSISSELGCHCQSSDTVREIIRAIRHNFDHFMDSVTPEDLRQAQLGLSHAFSRLKVKFNQHGDDNMVISAIALLTSLDKDVNTFSMRLREWYSVHFPELSTLIPDHHLYAKAVLGLTHRSQIENIKEVINDEILFEKIQRASENSIGREIDQVDLSRIIKMAERVDGLLTYRQTLASYLHDRMHNIAPNLTSLIGERMGAKLIAASGSLTNLSKSASSTIQILGSEKALFNALKKRKPTPKYGVLYNSAQVQAADTGDKGRVARSLANKLAIAARVDSFGEEFRGGFLGEEMKRILEEKMELSKKGKEAKPNFEAMVEAVQRARAKEQKLSPESQQNASAEPTPVESTKPDETVKPEEPVKVEEPATTQEAPKRRKKRSSEHKKSE